jgi:hypothetical protein
MTVPVKAQRYREDPHSQSYGRHRLPSRSAQLDTLHPCPAGKPTQKYRTFTHGIEGAFGWLGEHRC